MNLNTRAVRKPLTFLLALAIFCASLPLGALAQEAAMPAVAPPPAEPAAAESLPEPEPVSPMPNEPIDEIPEVTEMPTVEVPVTETPSSQPPVEPETPPVEPEVPAIPVEPIVDDPVIEAPVVEEPVAAPQSLLAEEPVAEPESTYFTITSTIDLPNGCAMTDASSTAYVFPTATTTEYLAVCAFAEAVENGTISEVTVTDSSFGLFVSSVNGVPAGTNEYWSMWINGGYASCGISCQSLAAGDTIAFVRTAYDPVTFAETQLDRLELTVGSLVDEYDNVLVPDTCTVTDVSSTTHAFPAGEDLLAVCALDAALDEGYISAYEFSDFGFGIFLSGLNGAVLGAEEFWALKLNDAPTDVGITEVPVTSGDVLSLVRTNWQTSTESDQVDLRIIGSVHVETDEGDGGEEGDPDEGGGGDGTGTPPDPDTFSISDAFDFLVSGQEEDGNWENGILTDWAAVAFAVSGAPSSAKGRLADYLREEADDVSSVQDHMRHAMALMALNINPYTGGPEDYIEPIVESFDGTQIAPDDVKGNIVNDDIFALIVLTNAGFDSDDEIIKKITAYIIAEQRNGAWANSVDVTAAAIQALSEMRGEPGVSSAISDAETFLRDAQRSDGSFGSEGNFTSSTAWTMQAIEALGQSPDDWKQGENTPLTYLADEQQDDGGLTTSDDEFTRLWTTAYAIPAVKGETWDDLLRNFKKPAGYDDNIGKSGDDDEDGDNRSDENKSGDEDDEESVIDETATTTAEILPLAFAASTTDPAVEPIVAADVAPVLAETTDVENPETVPESAEKIPPATSQLAGAAASEGGSWLVSTVKHVWNSFVGFLDWIF